MSRRPDTPLKRDAMLLCAVAVISMLSGCVFDLSHDRSGARYVVLAKQVDENRTAILLDDAPAVIKPVLREAIAEATDTGQDGDAPLRASDVGTYSEYFERKYRVELGTTYRGVAHVEHGNLIFELTIESFH